MTFAKRAGAQRTMLFHHDSMHPDHFLDELAETAGARWLELGGSDGQILLAAEGQELEI